VRRVVLDVDTGIDDALALLYAVACPSIELCGVTTVAGNVPVDVACANSRSVLVLAGAGRVPVARGAATTSAGGGPRTGRTNHGPDGLGGVVVPAAPASEPLGVHGLVRSVADRGAFTLVGLAPMTNVAEVAPLAEDLVLLGGELVPEEPPELNASHDLHATGRALAAGRPTVLYAIEVFEQVSVAPDDVARLQASHRPAARLAAELLRVRRSHLVGDAGAVVLLARPDLFQVERRSFGIVDGHLTETADGRPIDVVVGVEAAGAAAAFVEALLSAP
jgi:pyrimidine-specific ribonucleoside hydrolase